MKYEHLSYFTKGYVNAIFFTNIGFDGLGFYDFAPETLTRIIEDCAGFQMSNKRLLEKADKASQDGYTDEQAGHDLWLTRNGHDTGFWNRGLGETGQKMTAKAYRMGELYLFLGDDGKFYFE